MNKDITLEEYTNKFNRIFADKEEKGFSQEELTPLWKSLQNDDMDITFDDAYAGTIRTASRFTSGHSAGVDSDS